jgi:hypothetical protein
MYMLKNTLLYEEQVEYEDQKETFWRFVKDHLLEEGDLSGFRQAAAEAIPWAQHVIGKVKSDRFFVPLRAMPFWELQLEIDKKSKMYLTELDPPSKEKIERIRPLIRAFLEKYSPKTMRIPFHKEMRQYNRGKYSDGLCIKENHQDSTYAYCDFQYQAFMTTPHQLREVWLPPQGYKYQSNFWHSLASQSLQRTGWSCNDKSIEQIEQMMCKRVVPMTTLDLAGSGLQFPREYIIVVMEEISRMYKHPEISENLRIATNMLNNLYIADYQLGPYKPKRGVGLGYFTNLKSIVIGAILHDVHIVVAYDDDILHATEDHAKAVEILESYDLVINQKKTGVEWGEFPFFMGVGWNTTDVTNCYCAFQNHNTSLAAIFSARYHWQRKEIISTLEIDDLSPQLIAFQVELVFGYENYKSDYLCSIVEGGAIQSFPRRGYNSRIFLSPGNAFLGNSLDTSGFGKKPDFHRQQDSWKISVKDSRKHHYFRKSRYASRSTQDSSDYEFFNPYLIAKERYVGDGLIPGLKVPIWADQDYVLTYNESIGPARDYLSKDEMSQLILQMHELGAHALEKFSHHLEYESSRRCFYHLPQKEEDELRLLANADDLALNYVIKELHNRNDASCLETEIPEVSIREFIRETPDYQVVDFQLPDFDIHVTEENNLDIDVFEDPDQFNPDEEDLSEYLDMLDDISFDSEED